MVSLFFGDTTFKFISSKFNFLGSAFTWWNVNGYANEDGDQGGSC